jgi:hypothetical protein
MKTRSVFSPAGLGLLFALALSAPDALAFGPYLGKKFKDARFTASGGLAFGEQRAAGEVDFKFKGTSPDEIKVDFKGKVESDGRTRRFKGKIDFNRDGTVEIDGLPGQGDEKITGHYTIEGTTVKFEGERTVKLGDVGEVTVKITGEMSIDANGEVKIKGKVDAGPVSGRFEMNSAKDPPPENNK